MKKDEFMIVNGTVVLTAEPRSGNTMFVRRVDVDVATYERDRHASLVVEAWLGCGKSYLVTIEEREWVWGMTCQPPVPLPGGLSWKHVHEAWEAHSRSGMVGRVIRGGDGNFWAYLATIAGTNVRVGQDDDGNCPLAACRLLALLCTRGDCR